MSSVCGMQNIKPKFNFTPPTTDPSIRKCFVPLSSNNGTPVWWSAILLKDNGLPGAFLQFSTLPVSLNCWYQRLKESLLGARSVEYSKQKRL